MPPRTPDGQGDAYNALSRDLASVIEGDVLFSDADRALYAVDASNYREVPIGVVRPRTIDDLARAIDVCRAHDAPVLNRGAGTSIAGQAINSAVVMDTSRYLDRVIEIDPETQIARVEPGVVLDSLRRASSPYGLTFGPDPSTHARCTLGGMIGNDSCGAHSISWGKTRDNVEELDVITYAGERLRLGPDSTPESHQILERLAILVEDNAEVIRQSFPELPRRVSGYNLDALLPENGFDVVSALVGTEGTCVTVTEATVRLVETPKYVTLLVLGFKNIGAAAFAVPGILGFEPHALEGMDHRLVGALPNTSRWMATALPEGESWLLVEFAGESRLETERKARQAADWVISEGGAVSRVTVDNPLERRNLWSIREVGSGLSASFDDGSMGWPGWEDAAVPPESLGDYLSEFENLMLRYGRRGVPYGHFGDGCVHVRIDFDLLSPEGTSDFRRFMEDAADLVISYGGSLSGEHGDGQARAELLDRMYSPEVVGLFEEFKRIWDPDNRMNPHRVVQPRRLDENLRIQVPSVTPPPEGGFSFPSPHGWRGEMQRCIGVGKCVQIDPGSAVMCPSYLVTREERFSTRGRAHLLFEMMASDVVTDGWKSEEVEESLDLCLSCKGCKSDCPVQVDMATYKAEFLYHRYRGRIRPRSHYSMGWLPTWLPLATRFSKLLNSALKISWIARLARWVGGIDRARILPELSQSPFTRRQRASHAAQHPDVIIWPDTFSNYLDSEILTDALEVIQSVDGRVALPEGRVCCGLTWISTGQLDRARSILKRSLKTLEPMLDGETPIVSLEPSCTATLRNDLPELLPDDPRARSLAGQVVTFAEYLEPRNVVFESVTRDSGRPDQAIVQTHCHQHALLGRAADDVIMDRLGIEHQRLASSCCGLAGNFGFEAGHYDLSMAIGERVLLPAVRAADPSTEVIADGFSCRTQVAHGTGREAKHLVQVVAERLRSPTSPEPGSARS